MGEVWIERFAACPSVSAIRVLAGDTAEYMWNEGPYGLLFRRWWDHSLGGLRNAYWILHHGVPVLDAIPWLVPESRQAFFAPLEIGGILVQTPRLAARFGGEDRLDAARRRWLAEHASQLRRYGEVILQTCASIQEAAERDVRAHRNLLDD